MQNAERFGGHRLIIDGDDDDDDDDVLVDHKSRR